VKNLIEESKMIGVLLTESGFFIFVESNAEDEFLESGRIWLVNRSEVVNIDRLISPWYSM